MEIVNIPAHIVVTVVVAIIIISIVYFVFFFGETPIIRTWCKGLVEETFSEIKDKPISMPITKIVARALCDFVL